MTDKVKNVVFRAPLLSQSGYGVHARQLAEYLLRMDAERDDIDVSFDIVPWGATPWYVDPAACNGLIGKIIQRTEKKESYDLSFQLQLPNEWNCFLAEVNVGLSAVVETDRCHPEWVEACNRMSMVIVPSEFTKSVLSNSGELKTPVHVVPESWVPSVAGANLKGNDLELKLNTDFNLLLVSQFTGNNPENDRKNIAYTIKWTMEQFKDEENVGLIVKTNFGRLSKADRQQALETLSKIVIECQAGVGPKVYLLHGRMTEDEMVGLYTHPKVSALVNLTRGEGFGLPILEAAACGLPVIATDWSAHTEFLKQGRFMKIEKQMAPIHASRVDNQIFMEGAKWANVVEADYKRKVRKFHESPTIPRQWAKDLAEKLQVSHSPEAIQAQYHEVLKEIL